MALSRYSAGALIDFSLGAPLWLALACPPTKDTGATIPEVDYNGYARVLLAAGDASWTPWDGVSRRNAAAIALAPALSGGEVLVLAAALCTAAAAGDVMHPLDTVAFKLSPGDPDPQIAAGLLAIEP
jgi:hypothetical protein